MACFWSVFNLFLVVGWLSLGMFSLVMVISNECFVGKGVVFGYVIIYGDRKNI